MFGNKLLNCPKFKEDKYNRDQKILELNDNENMMQHNLMWDITKAIQRGKFIVLNCLYNIDDKSSDQIINFQKLEILQKIEPKGSRKMKQCSKKQRE